MVDPGEDPEDPGFGGAHVQVHEFCTRVQFGFWHNAKIRDAGEQELGWQEETGTLELETAQDFSGRKLTHWHVLFVLMQA
jgi:hypothetical protein